jgi:hypothetical protein
VSSGIAVSYIGKRVFHNARLNAGATSLSDPTKSVALVFTYFTSRSSGDFASGNHQTLPRTVATGSLNRSLPRCLFYRFAAAKRNNPQRGRKRLIILVFQAPFHSESTSSPARTRRLSSQIACLRQLW